MTNVMDETLLSRPSKPLRSRTLAMFLRVSTRDMNEKFMRTIEGNRIGGKCNIDGEDFKEFPKDIPEHLYIKRLTIRGYRGRTFSYLHARTKPSQVLLSEAAPIILTLDHIGVHYEATLASDKLVGQRTYEEGTVASEILKHLTASGLSSVLGPILENGSPYLLIIAKAKSSLPPKDRKLVFRGANKHSFVMSDKEEELIRLKLSHGGTLIDMREIANG